MVSLSHRIQGPIVALGLCLLMGLSIIKINPATEAEAKPNSPSQLVAFNNQQQEAVELKAAMAQQQAHAELAIEQDLDNKFKALQQKLNSYLAEQSGTYGYVLQCTQNLGSKFITKTIGYKQNEPFKMASTFKLPVNLYLYRQIEQHKLSLNDKLVYEARFYETGTGTLQSHHPGGSYTIRQLASLSIRLSDNVAVNMLIGKLGRNNILEYMRHLGTSGAPADHTPQATPADLVILLNEVENLAQSDPDLGNLMLTDLKTTVFNDRIPAGIPKGVPIAHKIGTLGGVINDAAIVYAPKGSYILAIMSKNVNENTAPKVEAHVSQTVWQELEGKELEGTELEG